MIELIDTHCHLNMLVQEQENTPITLEQIKLAQVYLHNAHTSNVNTVINIGTTVVESENSVKLAQHYDNVFATVGIYPTELGKDWRADFEKIKVLAQEKEKNKIVGIGEVGIDMYRPGYNFERQRDGFRAQIEMALAHDLALVVHSRAAEQETLAVIDEFKNDLKRVVMHCFSYGIDIAQELASRGFYLGIGGVLTYKNGKLLRDVVATTPLEYLVLETDAPYLSPEPKRGTRNEPAHIAIIAQYLAQLKNVSLENVAQITTQNAQTLFKLPK